MDVGTFFIFHSSFVIILIGAGVTRYVGYEGIMQIPEGQTENRMLSLEPYLQVTIKDGDKFIIKNINKSLLRYLKI